MLNDDGSENGENKSMGLISNKNNFARAAYFFVHFFCTTTTWNSTWNAFYRGIVCVPGRPFLSLPLIFILVAASISHFLTAAIKLSCFSSNENGLLCFLSLALALSLLSTLIWILKFSRKKTGLCCCFFLSKNPGGHAIYRRNARVLEMRKFLAGLHDWGEVRSNGRSSTKFF